MGNETHNGTNEMMRHFGYACMNLSLQTPKSPRIYTSRTLRMNRFTLERAGELAVQNSADLITILEWNLKNDIRFFRVGSDLFPFMDHPDLGYSLDDLQPEHKTKIVENLATAGKYAKSNGMRLSCHPGPYTCLASPKSEIVTKSIKSLEMHSLLADLLGYGEEFAINIHIGGVYDNKVETAKRFVDAYKSLPQMTQRRLTVENDDKASMWSMWDLWELIYQRCGVKLVLDIHHHKFCGANNSIETAARWAFGTWSGFPEIPKIHYSESRDNKHPQAHSDFIKCQIPILCPHTQYDVMIEAKSKDLALLDYRKQIQK